MPANLSIPVTLGGAVNAEATTTYLGTDALTSRVQTLSIDIPGGATQFVGVAGSLVKLDTDNVTVIDVLPVAVKLINTASSHGAPFMGSASVTGVIPEEDFEYVLSISGVSLPLTF